MTRRQSRLLDLVENMHSSHKQSSPEWNIVRAFPMFLKHDNTRQFMDKKTKFRFPKHLLAELVQHYNIWLHTQLRIAHSRSAVHLIPTTYSHEHLARCAAEIYYCGLITSKPPKNAVVRCPYVGYSAADPQLWLSRRIQRKLELRLPAPIAAIVMHMVCGAI